MGGLVIIADLGTVVLQNQGAQGGEPDGLLVLIDYILNAVFFSIAGNAVLRETGRVRLAAAAGLLAGTLAGLVVGAAEALAPQQPLPPGVTTESAWLLTLVGNATLGMILAVASAWFGTLGRKAAGS